MRWMDVPPGQAAALWHLLDRAEQARADRFRFAEDRDSYVAAHALLRAMLSRSAPVDPAAWHFAVAAGGKPHIDPSFGQPDLRFSLSHTRGMVACAVGRGHDLGIDVEDCERTLPVVELAQRFFAPVEADAIASLPPAHGTILFYRLWTLKEAYSKAIGVGITAPLSEFAFRVDQSPISITFLTPGADDPHGWQFAEFQPGPRHRLAVAVRRPGPDLPPLDAAAVSPDNAAGLPITL